MKLMDILNINDVVPLIEGKKVVFVTGVTGQDGSHMADYLLTNTDYFIVGGARRLSIKNHENIKHLEHTPRFKLVNFDLSDAHSISKIVEKLKPEYFINLAAQTFVGSSWDFPAQTWECNTTGVIHILEAIRQHKPTCRFYNAGSSEEYGNVAYVPQDENHPSKPRSPYGASKSAARQLVKVYRESYCMLYKVCCLITKVPEEEKSLSLVRLLREWLELKKQYLKVNRFNQLNWVMLKLKEIGVMPKTL